MQVGSGMMGKIEGSAVEELRGYLAPHVSFAVRRVAHHHIPGTTRKNSEGGSWVIQFT